MHFKTSKFELVINPKTSFDKGLSKRDLAISIFELDPEVSQEHSTSYVSKLIPVYVQSSSQRETFWKYNLILSSRGTSFPSFEKFKHISVKKGSFISKRFIFKLEKYFTNSSSTFELSNIEVLTASLIPAQMDKSNFSP